MRAWRLYNHTEPYVQAPEFSPVSGDGGLFQAGRWNHVGRRVVYASPCSALALVERLVHFDPKAPLPQGLTHSVVELTIPDSCSIEDVSTELFAQLMSSDEKDARKGTRDFGTAWLDEQRSLVLKVPSAVTPFDQNLLLNPLHPEFKAVHVDQPKRVAIDNRLFSLKIKKPMIEQPSPIRLP